MKKILLVIDDLGSGGAQNQMTLLAVGLQERAYDVTVFTYYPQDFFKYRLINKNIKLIFEQKKEKIGFSVINRLKNEIKQGDYYAMISYLDTPNFYATLAKKLSGKMIIHIASYRSMTNFDSISWMNLKQKEWVNKNATYLVANSHHERERWQSKYPNLKQKWLTIYNTVDTSKFFPDNSIKKGNKYLVVGSVGPAKNGLLVLEALNELNKMGIQINVLWIGQKVLHITKRKDYLDKMEQKIKEYNLSSQFIWSKPINNIEQAYRSHKALILASDREGLPNVVCEALSCGTPCIVSDVLDHSNLITSDKNGYLFDISSTDELVNVLIKMENHSEIENDEMKENSLISSKEIFDRSMFLSEYEKLIQ